MGISIDVPGNPARVMTIVIRSGLKAVPNVPLTEKTDSIAPRRVVAIDPATVAPAG
jgi:hypothetical protein